MNKKYNKGNALVVVILILAVLFIGGLFLSMYSSGQTRNTEKALGGDQTASLAEAGLNRAIHLITKQLVTGSAFEESSPKSSIPVALCYPLPVKTGNDNKLGDELGDDKALDISTLETDGIKNEFTITKDELLALETDDPDSCIGLDDYVNYIGNDKVESWDINIDIEIESAYKISSKNVNGEDYQVPGVDIPNSMPSDVREFLNNKKIPSVLLYFPDEIKLLDFNIPVNLHIPVIGDITIANVDVGKLTDLLVKPITKGTALAEAYNKSSSGVGITDLVSINQLLQAIAKKAGWGKWYPFEFSLYGENYFGGTPTMWPSGITVPDNLERCVEKYGTIRMTSIAEITFKNKTTSTRRISATKDFKVSDIMPMAPIHSMFIANTANRKVRFNDRGGQLYVNNTARRLYKLTELGKMKENKDHQGQIRVNFKPTAAEGADDDTPMMVNVSLIGGTDGPSLSTNSIANGALNIAAGSDALLMLGKTNTMNLANAKYNLDWTINSETVKKKDPETGKKVPVGIKLKSGNFNKGFSLSSKYTDRISKSPDYLANRKAYEKGPLKKHHDSQRLWNDEKFRLGSFDSGVEATQEKLKNWKENNKLLNFLPDLNKVSSNIFGFGAAMIKRPFGSSILGGAISFGSSANSNSFMEFELPNMGTSNSNYCLPSLGLGQNKTHLFGAFSLYPTLSRDIEGAVAKRYKQWHVTIVGLFAKDRLPLLPFAPYNIPPIPIPYWWTDEKIVKYDYDLFLLKAYDADHSADGMEKIPSGYTWYDPDEMENMPANWYSNEQYAKKSNYFYKDYQKFLDDIPNRSCEVDGVQALQLNGVTYIAGSLGNETAGGAFKPADGSDTLYVTGKGMIICSGNAILDCNIKYAPKTDEEEKNDPTVFSLICRNGGMAFMGQKNYEIHGSYYTNLGIVVGEGANLNIQGNWVTDDFQRNSMNGDIMIDYVAHRLRPTLSSVNPIYGKYDPKRYVTTLDNKWGVWRVDTL